MEKDEHPPRLYHGTPHQVHASERPFLDPRLAGGFDEGDPQEGHVFATPDLLMASLFAFKDHDCLTVAKTDNELVVVYKDNPPSRDAKGMVYEVPPQGFQQTAYDDGRPTGKWALVESEMQQVTDNEGHQTPGIPVQEPVREVAIRDLIEQEHMKVCVLTDALDADTYAEALDAATHVGAVPAFIHEALDRGWLRDITDTYLDQ